MNRAIRAVPKGGLVKGGLGFYLKFEICNFMCWRILFGPRRQLLQEPIPSLWLGLNTESKSRELQTNLTFASMSSSRHDSKVHRRNILTVSELLVVVPEVHNGNIYLYCVICGDVHQNCALED